MSTRKEEKLRTMKNKGQRMMKKGCKEKSKCNQGKERPRQRLIAHHKENKIKIRTSRSKGGRKKLTSEITFIFSWL